MQKRTYIKFSGILLLIAGTLIMGFAVFLPRLLDINAYRDEILSTLQQSLNRKVSFSSGKFAWHFGPSFDFADVSVKEPDGGSDFLKAEKITVKLALWPLLEKQVVLQDVKADGAVIHIVRRKDATLNIDDLLKPSKDTVQIHFRKVQLRRSTVQWDDAAIQEEPFSAVVRNITLNLEHLTRGRKGNLKLYCDLPAHSGSPGSVSLVGSLKLPDEGVSLDNTELNLTGDFKQADIGRFWPYYSRFIPFANPGGRLDLTTTFKGRMHEFAAKGKIRIAGSSVVWPKIFHYTIAPRSAQLDYDLRLSPRLIDIPALSFDTDGFRIKGSFQMHDYAGKDPRIVARASTPTFRYEDVRQYVPYGVIPADTSEYIEHKIKSGIFKLDTGLLDGRVSQIAHMEQGDNYKTLLIRGPVEKAVLSYGPKAPVFSNIKGTIELKDKNFNLIGMTAQFGESPLKLNGSITEYNTDKTSDYPVRMDITPHAPEVAWLARIAGANKLEFGGLSTLVLTGSGHYSAYRLNGSWELKQSIYSFPGAVRKPAGMANQLNFTSIISPGETKLTSLSYSLQSLSLSATALLKYRDQPYLNFELQTNPIMLSETSPILTGWQQYRPSGRAQAHINGSGNPEDFSAMNYRGTIVLNSFSVLPDEKLKTVSGINGTVSFNGNSLETSSMSVRYGDSPLLIKGLVRSLKNGEAEIQVTSPQLFLRDFNRATQKSDAAIRRLHGTLSIKDGRYGIKDLSGQLNSSNFNISGVYAGGNSPEANFSLTSSNLDVDDLILLAKPTEQPASLQAAPTKKSGQLPKAVQQAELKLKLAVDTGKYGRIPFSRLNASVSQESGIIYLQSLEAGIFGGKLNAKGRVAPGGGQGGNRYDLNINIDRVDADICLKALDISREVAGSLSLKGDVTARGDSMEEIKKTALGNLKLKLEKGSLHKFNVLSKMFSILNVSQLLKFQLPNMVSNGMPYSEITGGFAISDGIIATQDLFISSDAINISVIGKTDMIKEDLDFTIGVQPLQTVDKVVNRIPVVGWLLTGKDKDFLTAYFEAKGKWSDPQVKAIPAKSLGKGVLNVFRRVFELPVRLFTDTGEVILGK
jgi:uncharacterized protein involved in outer membrane biogenesis